MVFLNLHNLEELELVVYTDASYANLSGRVSTLSRSSKKIKRIVKSSLAAESLSMVDGIDASSYIRRIIQEIIPSCSSIPIICMIDKKSLFQNIHILLN